MNVFSFIGRSGSGKTRLIARLVPELKRRGWTVAVIKHCPHGFSLDRKGTDSTRFFEAGARGIALISSQATAVIQRSRKTPDFRAFARRHFPGIDILLIEGGRAAKGIPRIEVLGMRDRLRPTRRADQRIAVISDRDGSCGRPVFRHSQVREIAEFLESQRGSFDRKDRRVSIGRRRPESSQDLRLRDRSRSLT